MEKLQERLKKQKGLWKYGDNTDVDCSDLGALERRIYEEQHDLEMYKWVTQALCKQNGKNGPFVIDYKNFTPLSKNILFDINETAAFAEQSPKQWKYRTSRGAGMGKAVQPYSGMATGDYINGVKRNARPVERVEGAEFDQNGEYVPGTGERVKLKAG